MTERESPILNVTGLAKSYGTVRALDGVTFSVAPGSVVALLGPNGAGKTTTLKCVLGVIAFEGEVEVAGLSVRKHGKEARRRIGYLPQTPALADGDTCREALTFLADLKGSGHDRIDDLLRSVNLWDQRGTKVAHLSGGMRQRLALAAALLSDPPLLLLDEPTASLDVESQREFHDLLARLRDEGKTVILSTHMLDRLGDLVDRVIILHRGRIAVDGALGDLLRSSSARRFVVTVNGAGPGPLYEALQAAGIGADRIRPAETRWEELLAAALEGEAPQEESS
jgi:ABC-type multidrug transport system ATPase subunit